MKKLLASIFGIGYTVSPIDAIPDIIPVLGQADDLVVILFVICFLLTRGRR